MTDRRLLLLHTGGTLGMRPTEWGWEPGADLAGWLSGLMTEQLPDVAWDLVSLEPLIDSSNARPAEWQRIVDSVRQHRGSHQAFVVLHGTDTLAFSASALRSGSTRPSPTTVRAWPGAAARSTTRRPSPLGARARRWPSACGSATRPGARWTV